MSIVPGVTSKHSRVLAPKQNYLARKQKQNRMPVTQQLDIFLQLNFFNGKNIHMNIVTRKKCMVVVYAEMSIVLQ